LVSLTFLFFLPLLYLLSFPTRRSSDLLMVGAGVAIIFKDILPQAKHIYRSIFTQKGAEKWLPLIFAFMALLLTVLTGMGFMLSRSEEHTSELQSRFDLVCRLLLEKTII